ncbi:hypothetical protein ACIG3E_28470 [Streptomyces sp. NPDC053474]|uniref:hypothetical protein n=1 Tax=Streptomyces sp. NPDC053474 TaxID=3365704 RepID=UPI0037D60D82
MTAEIVVHRASPTGGRRVDVHGENVGVAHSVADVTEFLRRAGLDLDPVEVAVSPLIEWRGGGPEGWGQGSGGSQEAPRG